MIAAHKTLRFGTHVRVTDLDNGWFVILTIVDRGPFIRGRVIDVSASAVDELGFRQAGVKLERLRGRNGLHLTRADLPGWAGRTSAFFPPSF